MYIMKTFLYGSGYILKIVSNSQFWNLYFPKLDFNWIYLFFFVLRDFKIMFQESIDPKTIRLDELSDLTIKEVYI